jgi:hypothetical protein
MNFLERLFGRKSSPPHRASAPLIRVEPDTQNRVWQLQGQRLVCQLDLSNLPSPQPDTSLEIKCSVSRYLNGTVATDVSIKLRPYLYLMPDGQPLPDHLVKPPFLLGLVADGSGAGTEASPLVQGGYIETLACAQEDVDAAFLQVSARDTALVLRTVARGRDMTLTLLARDLGAVKLRLRIPGDSSFAQLYQRLQNSV